MLDPPARRLVGPPLDKFAAVLARAGVSAVQLTALGWLSGLGACTAIVTGHWWVALGLWLANRLLDGLDGAVARRVGPTDLGGFLDIVADFSIYAGFVLAVAIEVPDARLASAALLVAYYISATAFLTLSALLEKRAMTGGGDGRSVHFVGGLAEGTETVIAYALLTVLPEHAAVIIWVFTAAVAVTAAQRVVNGVTTLSAPISDLSTP